MAKIYKPIITRIDTTANWTTLNPVPGKNEQCIEVLGGGLFKLKVGDGVTPWIALDYHMNDAGDFVGNVTDLETPQKDTVVSAINSIQEQVNSLSEKLSSLGVSYDEAEEELIINGVDVTVNEDGELVVANIKKQGK